MKYALFKWKVHYSNERKVLKLSKRTSTGYPIINMYITLSVYLYIVNIIIALFIQTLI